VNSLNSLKSLIHIFWDKSVIRERASTDALILSFSYAKNTPGYSNNLLNIIYAESFSLLLPFGEINTQSSLKK